MTIFPGNQKVAGCFNFITEVILMEDCILMVDNGFFKLIHLTDSISHFYVHLKSSSGKPDFKDQSEIDKWYNDFFDVINEGLMTIKKLRGGLSKIRKYAKTAME